MACDWCLGGARRVQGEWPSSRSGCNEERKKRTRTEKKKNRAISASSSTMLVMSSRDRPTEGKKSDAFYRLVGQLSAVCNDLSMRHAMRPEDREAVHDLCEDLWDDHEGTLSACEPPPPVRPPPPP